MLYGIIKYFQNLDPREICKYLEILAGLLLSFWNLRG